MCEAGHWSENDLHDVERSLKEKDPLVSQLPPRNIYEPTDSIMGIINSKLEVFPIALVLARARRSGRFADTALIACTKWLDQLVESITARQGRMHRAIHYTESQSRWGEGACKLDNGASQMKRWTGLPKGARKDEDSSRDHARPPE